MSNTAWVEAILFMNFIMIDSCGICRVFVILSVLAVGNLSENLCPEVGHLSILLEAVITSFL